MINPAIMFDCCGQCTDHNSQTQLPGLSLNCGENLVITPAIVCHYFPLQLLYLSSHTASPAFARLYCLVTEAFLCKQLAKSHYMKVGFEPVTSWSRVQYHCTVITLDSLCKTTICSIFNDAVDCFDCVWLLWPVHRCVQHPWWSYSSDASWRVHFSSVHQRSSVNDADIDKPLYFLEFCVCVIHTGVRHCSNFILPWSWNFMVCAFMSVHCCDYVVKALAAEAIGPGGPRPAHFLALVGRP